MASHYRDRHYRWVLLYWMPYDNNLSPYADPIISMLKVPDTGDVVVVVVADLSDRGMERIVLSNGVEVERTTLDTTDSSSTSVLSDFLQWAATSLKGDRWMFTVLGHGGKLDEISPDLRPDEVAQGDPSWMTLGGLAKALGGFVAMSGTPFDLVFLQNCCKGTLEAHYQMGSFCRFTLSSQLELGVPNTYYSPFLSFLQREATANGLDAASAVMDNEEQCHVLAVTDNDSLLRLPPIINRFITAVEQRAAAAPAGGSAVMPSAPSNRYSGQDLGDAIVFIREVAERFEIADDITDGVLGFLQREVIRMCRARSDAGAKLNGLSLFLPKSHEQLRPHEGLELYGAASLPRLYRLVMFSER